MELEHILYQGVGQEGGCCCACISTRNKVCPAPNKLHICPCTRVILSGHMLYANLLATKHSGKHGHAPNHRQHCQIQPVMHIIQLR
jgi:hypothetical protein